MTWTVSEKAQIDKMDITLQELVRVVRGKNGETGILGRIEKNEQLMQAHLLTESMCPIRDVVTALYGDRAKGIESKGLVNYTEDQRKFMDTLKRWAYLVGSTMMTASIVIIINTIRDLIQAGR